MLMKEGMRKKGRREGEGAKHRELNERRWARGYLNQTVREGLCEY